MTNPRDLARVAFARADELEREILTRWPDAWWQMDHMRTRPPQSWPDWCLLPMAAAAAVTGGVAPSGPPPIALVSALYAWRFARSVYVVEPTLMSRLLDQVPDSVGLDDLTGLPEWCVYVAADDGAGLWVHLEFDVNTGRPELRLLLDVPDAGTLPLPVYLDRPTLTEALADFRATALATRAGPGEVVPGQDVRGGMLDASVAEFADRVDAYVGLAAYLARPEADIGEQGRPLVRPQRSRRPVRGRTVWLVGYRNAGLG